MPLAAHAGHWTIWVLYAVPVLIVIGSIVTSVVRQRRDPRPAADAEADSATES